MNYSEIKNLVGTANVTVGSDMRYSELRALVKKAAVMENGILTIVVEPDTLNTSELKSLADVGGRYVSFDLTWI